MAKKPLSKYGIYVVVLASMLLSAASGWAQEKKKKSVQQGEEVLIQGEIQKPEAYFILQRKTFDFLLGSQAQEKFDSLEPIFEAVKSDVF